VVLKGAPNFKVWPDAVDGKWKQQFLMWLAMETGIDILVETGTCEGATPLALHNFFEEIHTVELHPELFHIAYKWIGGFPNVFMYPGDSAKILPQIIKQFPNQPLLFWLDAHSSGPHTAQDNPLSRELKVITNLCPNALIVIDDQMNGEFVDGEGRSTIDPDVDLTGWHHEYRTGEVLMYKEGRYNIPPFD
jgi:hypothetical protein